MIERTYLEPADLAQARVMLAQHEGSRVIAGGTDLVVAARSGKASLPQHLVAIHRLKELSGIEPTADGGLRIGALTTHADLEASPLVVESWSALADASALVGSPATRHLGTLGGNVCNASPAMELGSPLLVFDARVELASAESSRSVPISSFVTGPGRTSAHPGELMTAVVLPACSPGGLGTAYIRLEYRVAMEIAVVGVAAMIRTDDAGRCVEARIALTAVAPACVRATEAEEILRGSAVEAADLENASHATLAAARPIDDVRASAAYRRAMLPVIARRALIKALDRAGTGGAR